jgi:hypothetical protein
MSGVSGDDLRRYDACQRVGAWMATNEQWQLTMKAAQLYERCQARYILAATTYCLAACFSWCRCRTASGVAYASCGDSIEVDTQPDEFTELRLTLPRAAASPPVR